MAEHIAKHCLTSSSKDLRASEARLGGEGGGCVCDTCYVHHPAEATTHVQQGNCYLEILRQGWIPASGGLMQTVRVLKGHLDALQTRS